jgi:hypothetical protein
MTKKSFILKINGREQTRVPMYFELTCEAYDRFADNFTKAADYQVQCKMQGKKPHLDIWGSLIRKGIREYLLQHLFAAMCLEGFIYDYAATNFTDTYSKKYLDKLDLISKWVIVPRLVLGKEFPRGGRAFSYIRDIKKERDKLVHSKSRPQLTDEEREKELSQYVLKPSTGGNRDSDLEVNVFRQLVEILNTLKSLEEQSGRQQNWWEIVVGEESG